MKKLFVLLVAGLAFVACNDAAEGDKDPVDSSLNKVDSTGEAREDSVENATDSLKNTIKESEKKTDSANNANSSN